jgi:hypothetical protein
VWHCGNRRWREKDREKQKIGRNCDSYISFKQFLCVNYGIITFHIPQNNGISVWGIIEYVFFGKDANTLENA